MKSRAKVQLGVLAGLLIIAGTVLTNNGAFQGKLLSFKKAPAAKVSSGVPFKMVRPVAAPSDAAPNSTAVTTAPGRLSVGLSPAVYSTNIAPGTQSAGISEVTFSAGEQDLQVRGLSVLGTAIGENPADPVTGIFRNVVGDILGMVSLTNVATGAAVGEPTLVDANGVARFYDDGANGLFTVPRGTSVTIRISADIRPNVRLGNTFYLGLYLNRSDAMSDMLIKDMGSNQVADEGTSGGVNGNINLPVIVFNGTGTAGLTMQADTSYMVGPQVTVSNLR